jgi:hypothetical protein
MLQKALVSTLENFIYCCNFTNKVRVCRATLSRQRPSLPDPKQYPDPVSDPELEPKLPYLDPESDPKQIIPDPQHCVPLQEVEVKISNCPICDITSAKKLFSFDIYIFPQTCPELFIFNKEIVVPTCAAKGRVYCYR